MASKIVIYRSCSKCSKSLRLELDDSKYLLYSRSEYDSIGTCDECKAKQVVNAAETKPPDKPIVNPKKLVEAVNDHFNKKDNSRMVFRTEEGHTACCWCYRNKADAKTRLWRRLNAKTVSEAKDVWYPICNSCKQYDTTERKAAVKDAEEKAKPTTIPFDPCGRWDCGV